MGFFDWAKDKVNKVYDFFSWNKEQEQNNSAPVSITPANFPQAPLTWSTEQPAQETSLIQDISSWVQKKLVDIPVWDSFLSAISPQIGATKNLIDLGSNFFFWKEENTDKTQEQIDAKNELNKMGEEINKDKNGSFFGSIWSFFGQRKISDSNYTYASILSENKEEDVISGEIMPRVKNIFRAVDDTYSKQLDWLSFWAMESPISSWKAKEWAQSLAVEILRNENDTLNAVAKYIDNPEQAKKDWINTEWINENYNNIKNWLGLWGVDDKIVKDIMNRSYKQVNEARTNIFKVTEKQNKIKDLYKVYDPQWYASYNKEQDKADAISKSKEVQFGQELLKEMEKSWLTIKDKDWRLAPKDWVWMKYYWEAIDDFKRNQQTFATITQQRNAIHSFWAQKWIDMWENIANKNYETILDNYKELELIRLQVARWKEWLSNKDLVRLVEKEVENRWYDVVNSFLLKWVVSANGWEISMATKQLTPQDFLSKQARDEDMWVRFNTKLTPKNFLAIMNDVGSSMFQYPAGIIWQQLARENIISELDASDISNTSDLNPTKWTQSIWDLWYNLTSKIKWAAPETISMWLNFWALNSATNSATQSINLIKWIRAWWLTKNILSSIARASVKAIPENMMQNALFHGVDSSWINTPDQLAFDTIWWLLWVGFDVYGQAKWLIRYTKNKGVVEDYLKQRWKISSFLEEVSKAKELNPNITDSEAYNTAKVKVKEMWDNVNVGRFTLDEMKQFTNDIQNIKTDVAVRKSKMSPQEVEQLNNIEKAWYARARIFDDIFSKETITDADVFKYNQILWAAWTNSVIISDLTKVVDKMLPWSQKKILGVIEDMSINKFADNATARLPFSFTNPQEVSYLQKITQKLAPEWKYSLEDLWDIAKSIESKETNPLWLQKDLLEKQWEDYKYFRKTETWDYVLNNEWFKKLWIIDNRWWAAVWEKALWWEDFYKAVEENPIEWISSDVLDSMRKNKTYESVKQKVMEVIPC